MSSVSTVSAVLSDHATSDPSTVLTMFALPGRVALVTGGMRGIGLEIALAYAEAGATVYCLDLPAHPDRDFIKVQNHVAGLPPLNIGMMKGAKGRLEYASCDVTKQKEMWAIVEGIAAKEGKIDVCVCSAGILHAADVLEYPAEEWQKVRSFCGVEYWRCWCLLATFSITSFTTSISTASSSPPKLLADKWSNRTPRAALSPWPVSVDIVLTKCAFLDSFIHNSFIHDFERQGMQWTAYNTSKAAVIQMTRSLACELGPKGIRVNSISPGYVYTEYVILLY